MISVSKSKQEFLLQLIALCRLFLLYKSKTKNIEIKWEKGFVFLKTVVVSDRESHRALGLFSYDFSYDYRHDEKWNLFHKNISTIVHSNVNLKAIAFIQQILWYSDSPCCRTKILAARDTWKFNYAQVGGTGSPTLIIGRFMSMSIIIVKYNAKAISKAR